MIYSLMISSINSTWVCLPCLLKYLKGWAKLLLNFNFFFSGNKTFSAPEVTIRFYLYIFFLKNFGYLDQVSVSYMGRVFTSLAPHGKN